MKNDRYGLIGLCLRAGKLALGAEKTEKSIKSGAGRLALLDEGASENTQKCVKDACAFAGRPLLRLPSGALALATGKDNRMAASVEDENFAGAMQNAFGDTE